MAKGYRNSSGVDFDSLFDPYVSGTKPAATGLRDSSGVDLNQAYAPIAVGSKGPDVGFRTSGGSDVSNLWAAAGTAVYALPIDGDNFFAYSSGNISGAMQSLISFTLQSSGSYAVSHTCNSSHTANTSGTWLPSGHAASEYQVQYVVTQNSSYPTGPATIVNDASSYVACTTNRVVSASASVGQSSAMDLGGTYTIEIRIKKIATGVVNTTTIHFDVESVGSG